MVSKDEGHDCSATDAVVVFDFLPIIASLGIPLALFLRPTISYLCSIYG